MFGFTPSERPDLDRYMQRLHPEDCDSVRQTFARALDGGGTYQTEYRVVLPEGKTHWIASHGRVEFNHAGKPVVVRSVSLDITDRKQAEKEAQQQRVELTHLARVAMLGELSGSLAHEMNQPLTSILSNAQAALRFLAHDDADLEEVRSILKDIVDEDKRAGEVIHRLRVLLHKGEVQYRPFDLNEMVRDVLKLMRTDLVDQGVTVHTDLAQALPVANADRVQLQQVLLNLVMNACDAMSTGPADDQTVTIRTAPGEHEGIRVSVADRGVGLQPDLLEKVFEPFFTTKPHGTGLGLSVCRTIVTAHGGKLWAVNNPEKGATFHFTLPVFREPSRSARARLR
jgi:PAS domain S-box-containing protein